MDLRGYLRVLRRRWRLVALFAAAGLLLAGAFTALSTPVYQAQSEVFVSLRGGDSTVGAYQGSLFSQQRVKSYTKVVTSPSVTTPVIQDLGLAMTPAELAAKITATAPVDTVLIDISVRDGSATRARDIANAVSTEFAKAVSRLETTGTRLPSTVTVTVIRPATAPGRPVTPRTTVDLALGLLVGLAVGFGAAVLREVLDTSVKTSEDLQRLTGSAALGVVNYDPRAADQPLVSQLDHHSPRGEAYRSLRTNLRFVDVDHPPRVVVLTSSVSGEGKSTTACNLAIALAEAGVRVVLVEGDLRRPRIADYMGLEGSVGLTDVLVGRTGLDEVLQPWSDGTLSVLASGELPPNPSELLGSTQMRELLTELRDRCDLVLVDAPPLLPVTDAAVLSRSCDGAIVVVRHGKTTGEQVTRGLEALRTVGARLLGTVLNMAPASGADGYGYGYGYGPVDAGGRSGSGKRSRPIAVRDPGAAGADSPQRRAGSRVG